MMATRTPQREYGSSARQAARRARRANALARFSANHVLQSQLQRQSIRTGRLLCRPTSIYVALTSRCDARCAMCDMWRREPLTELSTDAWTKALLDMRRWLGPYHVNFNGGEAYLRGDFISLLRFCADNGILAGFITNALHIDREMARETVKAEPFNISISLDGIRARTHDALRGRRGAFDRVMETLEHFSEFKREYRSNFRLIAKATIMRQNLAELPDLVRWVRRRGDMAIFFQPVIPLWSRGARKQFEVDIELLDRVIDELIERKRQGAPILNSVGNLELVKPYFRDETLPNMERDVCHVGVKNLFLHPEGDVYLCEHAFDPIGNVTERSIRDIWTGETAEQTRRRIVECKRPCLQTCIVKRSLWENMDLFRNLVLR